MRGTLFGRRDELLPRCESVRATYISRESTRRARESARAAPWVHELSQTVAISVSRHYLVARACSCWSSRCSRRARRACVRRLAWRALPAGARGRRARGTPAAAGRLRMATRACAAAALAHQVAHERRAAPEAVWTANLRAACARPSGPSDAGPCLGAACRLPASAGIPRRTHL